MKNFIYLISIFSIASCCLGNRKCNQGFTGATFRIVDKLTSQDLVFGSNAIYNPRSIQFFSMKNLDTTFHLTSIVSHSSFGQDSVFFIDFGKQQLETVFLKLNNSDMDTLSLLYTRVDGSPCCDDYVNIKPLSFNNTYLETTTLGITLLKK